MELSYAGKKDLFNIRRMIDNIRHGNDSFARSDFGSLIYGENFSAMSRMIDTYEGTIDLVYIDPPFNTQSNFYTSQDRCASISYSSGDELAYSDKWDFEEYIEFMRERIYLISLLMSPVSTLYVHIDIKVGHYIKIILDEIFGKSSFINEITRIKSNPKNFQRKAYGNQKDVIFVYARVPGENIFNNIKEQMSADDILRLYPKTDQLGRRYTTVPCHAPGETKMGSTAGEWRGLPPPPGRHWRCAPAELEKLDRQGLIEWSANKVPRIIKYADNHCGKKIQDIWLDFKDPLYPHYPTEKNIDMLERIIRQSSNPDSLVLDCFCGSGTFLAAALKNGRRPVGIDCSKAAIKAARKRPELKRLPLIVC